MKRISTFWTLYFYDEVFIRRINVIKPNRVFIAWLIFTLRRSTRDILSDEPSLPLGPPLVTLNFLFGLQYNWAKPYL
jgi:hypothetical protein